MFPCMVCLYRPHGCWSGPYDVTAASEPTGLSLYQLAFQLHAIVFVFVFVRVCVPVQWTSYRMSAEENAAHASTEADSGHVTSPEASTEPTESKPEVMPSDHVTDDTSSPQLGACLFPL